jgi:hypothetical protein
MASKHIQGDRCRNAISIYDSRPFWWNRGISCDLLAGHDGPHRTRLVASIFEPQDKRDQEDGWTSVWVQWDWPRGE